MISRDQSPLRSPPTPSSAWSISIIERIASRRVEAMHPRIEMRHAGRKSRFSRNFACFRFPDATNGKKVDSKIFAPLPFDPFLALLDLDRQTVPPSTVILVRCFHASFVISSFLFLHFFQSVIPFLFLSAFPSLFISQSRVLSLAQIHIHVHTRTHMHTCIHPLHFDSVLVTGLCFNIYGYYLR